MYEVMDLFRRISSFFNLEVKVEFEMVKPVIPSAYEIFFIREQRKAIIRGTPDVIKDYAKEICAKLKLGEKHPLLCTFYFQPGVNKSHQLSEYCNMFFDLCHPLQEAWAWRIMQAYLPKKEFINELNELLSFYDHMESTLPLMESLDKRKVRIGLYIIFYALGVNVEIKMGDREYDSLKDYLEALKIFSLKEPDPHFFIRLPVILSAPYRVFIEKEPHFYYKIVQIQ